jgi:diguanylate cyclase (GGDEF)-like protein
VSPLTGLPGNVQIEAEIQRRNGAGELICVLWLDLDNFKAFNDRYGFIRGDKAINYLAAILREVATNTERAFVGHIGGDDFVVVAPAEAAEPICQAIVGRFDKNVRELYDPEDAARGGIGVTDRLGREIEYPILSVSIGAATNENCVAGDHRLLVEVATEMKSFAKKRPGSVFAIDRRGRGPDDVPARTPSQAG